MRCLRYFLHDSYQHKLRLFAQSKSERYEDTIDSYKKIFIAQLRIAKDSCNNECINKEQCAKFKEVVNGIDETSIENFFDELKNIYLDWINANTSNAITKFKNLMVEYELFQFSKPLKKHEVYFKGRKTEQVITKWDMFHIPFNKRYLINNQRFSLTGQPMVYIGSSVLNVAKEIESDDVKKIKFSTFQVKEDSLKIYDLKNNFIETETDIIVGDLLETPDNGYTSAKFFKIILASVCSFQKRQELSGYSFCEEYVLPQILAQILKTEEFNGVSYNSTKRYENIANTCENNNFNDDYYKENIAIFTELNTEHVYDKNLYDKLSISVPINFEKIFSVTKDDLQDITNQIEKTKSQEKITLSEIILKSFERKFADILIEGEEYCNTDYGKMHMYLLYTVLNDILVK